MRLGIPGIHPARDCATVVQKPLHCAVQMLEDIMKELLRRLITLILGNQTVPFSRASTEVKLQAFINQ